MGGDVGERAEANYLPVLVVHQAGVLAVAPVGPRVTVNVREDLQHQLAAQIGDHVDAPAAGGVAQPLAAPAGVFPDHTEVVVAQLLEAVVGDQRCARSVPRQIQVDVVQVGLAGIALVPVAAVDAHAVPAAGRRQREREPVGGAAHQGEEGARQGRIELLGCQHAFQQQVGVVAHLVQVVAGGGHQQAHRLTARRLVAVRLGALGNAFQAAHGGDADGLVEVQRRIGAARVQLPQQGPPPRRGDPHRAARRRQRPFHRRQSRGRLAQSVEQGLQGGTAWRGEGLQVGVPGFDGAFLEAQQEQQGLRQGAPAALIGGHDIEQAQSEIDGGHAPADGARPYPRHHRCGLPFVEAGGARPFADQHDAPPGQCPTGAAAGEGDCLVGQAHGIAEPVHQTHVATQPFARCTALRRRPRDRGVAYRSHHALACRPAAPHSGRGRNGNARCSAKAPSSAARTASSSSPATVSGAVRQGPKPTLIVASELSSTVEWLMLADPVAS